MKTATYQDFVSFFSAFEFFFMDLVLQTGQYIIQCSSKEDK